MLTFLAFTYILLLITQRLFGFYSKEYTAGLITISFVLCVCCFINSFYIAGSIWGLLTLLEYNGFLKLK
jgi:hypothetical protein